MAAGGCTPRVRLLLVRQPIESSPTLAYDWQYLPADVQEWLGLQRALRRLYCLQGLQGAPEH